MKEGDKSQQPESQVEVAINSWRLFGNKQNLVNLIRSDHPLTKRDRELIADVIEGKIKLGKGKPPLAYLLSRQRIRNMPISAAAFECDRLKSEWRKNGPPAGVKRGDIPKTALKQAARQFKVPEDALAARLRLPLEKRYV